MITSICISTHFDAFYGFQGEQKHLLLAHLFDKPCFLGLLALKVVIALLFNHELKESDPVIDSSEKGHY